MNSNPTIGTFDDFVQLACRAARQMPNGCWRGVWKIENGLHWVRDVTLGEDASRIRTGAARQILAALRNAIISCFRADKVDKVDKVYNIVATMREYS